MTAIWKLPRAIPTSYPRLENDIDVDVAIVGGGATGLAAAAILSEAGERVAVLEAHRVGSGSTGSSTGNLYATLSQGLAGLRRKWDQDTVNQVVAMRRQAMDDIERNVERYGIDCQFERRPLHFCLERRDSDKQAMLDRELEVSAAAGLNARLVDEVGGSGLPIWRALRIDDQAQYNPQLYCDGLAKAVVKQGGSLYENSAVVDVDAAKGLVCTEVAKVRAGNILFATHTPKGVNMLQAEMEPYREQGVAAALPEGSAVPQGIFWMQDSSHSVRGYYHEGRAWLVVVGEKYQTGHDREGANSFRKLEDYAREHFAVDNISHRWSAQQYQPADMLPYIGRSGHENVYVATGFAADGLTWSEVAAQIVSHQILGRKDANAGLLNARRFTPGKSAKSWLEVNAKVTKHLSTDYFGVEKLEDLEQIPAGEGKIVKIAGDSYAVYRSAEGRISAVSPVCPHMKCMVHWNGADKSWDCPCHGSRFAVDGEVLEGPAYRPLEKRQPPL